jgi:hypothetical protein
MATCNKAVKARAYLSNLLFFGDSFSRYKNKYGSFGRRDRAEFKMKGLTFTLRKTKIGWKLWEKHKPSLKAKNTAILSTKCDEQNIDEVKETIENLCWLMTFVYGSKVTCPYIGFYGAKLKYADRLGSPFPFEYQYPVIPTEFPEQAVKNFLESVYDRFILQSEAYNLKVLIELHHLSRTARFVEVKFLLACILMESLKYHYAKNVKKFKQNKDEFFLDSKGNKLSFRKLLEMLGAALNLKIDTSFIDLRDKIIHQGIIGDESIDLQDEWEKLINQINKIILKILDYSGRYYNIEKRFAIEMLT